MKTIINIFLFFFILTSSGLCDEFKHNQYLAPKSSLEDNSFLDYLISLRIRHPFMAQTDNYYFFAASEKQEKEVNSLDYSDFPADIDNYVYRGMRLRLKDIIKLMKNGFTSSWKLKKLLEFSLKPFPIYVTHPVQRAAEYAIKPFMLFPLRKQNISFYTVVFQFRKSKMQGKFEGFGGQFYGYIPPEAIEVYIYDRYKRKFVNVTNDLKSLNQTEINTAHGFFSSMINKIRIIFSSSNDLDTSS